MPTARDRRHHTVQVKVRRFAQAQRTALLSSRSRPSRRHLGQKHLPDPRHRRLRARRTLPVLASAHMTIVTAKVAGVPRLSLCARHPSGARFRPPPLLPCTSPAPTEIYLLGGVQAVAAMQSAPKRSGSTCSPVPGNAYVAEAKRQLFGEVGIDLFAGPTEMLIVADAAADPFIVAVDLLSQAEHGPDSPAVLMTNRETLARAIGPHRRDPAGHAHQGLRGTGVAGPRRDARRR